jgi:hypothetical protein
MNAFITWLHRRLFPSFVSDAAAVRVQLRHCEDALHVTQERALKLEARLEAKQEAIYTEPHPIIAFIQEPKKWRTEIPMTRQEAEACSVFFKSSAGAKLDIMIHNIALQDMQRAWQATPSTREFEIGAAQGRLAAWVTIKQLPETLLPQQEQTEAGAGTTPSLDHLRP